MQVVSTLARYAQLSVAESYLCQAVDVSQDYHWHLKKGMVPLPDLLAGEYSLSIRMVALTGKGGAALRLISVPQSRGVRVSGFMLGVVCTSVLCLYLCEIQRFIDADRPGRPPQRSIGAGEY